jgi:hypothetical protein
MPNDKAAQAINAIADSDLKDQLLSHERMYSTAMMPWAQHKILREELAILAIGYVRLQQGKSQ